MFSYPWPISLMKYRNDCVLSEKKYRMRRKTLMEMRTWISFEFLTFDKVDSISLIPSWPRCRIYVENYLYLIEAGRCVTLHINQIA